MIDDKSKRVIIAAAEVFLRYGYARTTMGDIAKATGISRPALYILFPGKEQIFEAATMFLARQRLEEIRSAVSSCQGLEAKLIMAFEMLLVTEYVPRWSDDDARRLSISFTAAFGCELTPRLDLAHALRTRALDKGDVEWLRGLPLPLTYVRGLLEEFE
jgi:AcrR family transcriptional regulator